MRTAHGYYWFVAVPLLMGLAVAMVRNWHARKSWGIVTCLVSVAFAVDMIVWWAPDISSGAMSTGAVIGVAVVIFAGPATVTLALLRSPFFRKHSVLAFMAGPVVYFISIPLIVAIGVQLRLLRP